MCQSVYGWLLPNNVIYNQHAKLHTWVRPHIQAEFGLSRKGPLAGTAERTLAAVMKITKTLNRSKLRSSSTASNSQLMMREKVHWITRDAPYESMS